MKITEANKDKILQNLAKNNINFVSKKFNINYNTLKKFANKNKEQIKNIKNKENKKIIRVIDKNFRVLEDFINKVFENFKDAEKIEKLNLLNSTKIINNFLELKLKINENEYKNKEQIIKILKLKIELEKSKKELELLKNADKNHAKNNDSIIFKFAMQLNNLADINYKNEKLENIQNLKKIE